LWLQGRRRRDSLKNLAGETPGVAAIPEKRRVEARPKFRSVGIRCGRYMQITPLLVLETHFA
jgi:hypothetical protein